MLIKYKSLPVMSLFFNKIAIRVTFTIVFSLKFQLTIAILPIFRCHGPILQHTPDFRLCPCTIIFFDNGLIKKRHTQESKSSCKVDWIQYLSAVTYFYPSGMGGWALFLVASRFLDQWNMAYTGNFFFPLKCIPFSRFIPHFVECFDSKHLRPFCPFPVDPKVYVLCGTSRYIYPPDIPKVKQDWMDLFMT